MMSVSFEKLTGITIGNYHLEQYIGQSKIGPIFLARADATTTYLLRFLTGTMNLPAKDYEVYLERFQYQAGRIAALQHPYILPLLDYGAYRGLAYLVSPRLPMRSLGTRLARNGPLDIVTAGRYLDQIATALEYAHEHAVLHGSLSVDCIFIRLDGHLVVADFGVRSLVELQQQDTQRGLLDEWSMESAPEQLLGKPAGPTTDVYALGAVIYYLLTGTPVFSGSTLDEVIQQHLYASIPPLIQLRSDLPAGLYSILARALAKDPAQRFHQPGALANAYHHIVAPNNRTRMPFVVFPVPSSQIQQQFMAADSQADTPFREREWSSNGTSNAEPMPAAQHPARQNSIPHSLHGFPDANFVSLRDGPRPELMRRLRQRNTRRTALIAAFIALMVVVASTIGITLLARNGSAAQKATGQVTFFTNPNESTLQTDALNIALRGLNAPPAGSSYDAWLINVQTEQVTALGTLKEHQQSWTLPVPYTETTSNLLASGAKLEVTQEQGAVKVPTGTVILAGSFPPQAFAHIQHLLVSYPDTPRKIGLLVGALEQTHLLGIQAAVLQSATTSHNTVAIDCIAQSLIDIIEGKHGSHYQPLDATCIQQDVTATGDRFGLLTKGGYLTGAEEHASLAISQPDATPAMHQHAALLDIALTNITGWVTTIDQDALLLRANPANLTPVQAIVRLADTAYHGVDTNGDGQIDPVAGEAGALTAYQQGQLMATLSLTPG